MKIMPEFNDDTDKIIMLIMIICTVFCAFISPLVVILFLKKYISEPSYLIAKAFLNFELLLTLISLIFIIPIIGWLAALFVGPILYIWNFIVVVLSVCAIVKKSEVSVPTPYEFI